jgi:hypothetical protein
MGGRPDSDARFVIFGFLIPSTPLGSFFSSLEIYDQKRILSRQKLIAMNCGYLFQ